MIAAVANRYGTRRARVLLLPTFSGCPAIALMRDMVHDRLEQLGLAAQVEITRDGCWSSDRITAAGRRALAQAGIAPPAPASAVIELFEPAPCPHCGSHHTERLAQFGSTACKALYRCIDCREPFDYFKPY